MLSVSFSLFIDHSRGNILKVSFSHSFIQNDANFTALKMIDAEIRPLFIMLHRKSFNSFSHFYRPNPFLPEITSIKENSLDIK